MGEIEPQKVTAIRSAVATRLGIDSAQIEAQERRVIGSDLDDPLFLTLLIPRKQGLDDTTIDDALLAVNAGMWQHPAALLQLRWEYKPDVRSTSYAPRGVAPGACSFCGKPKTTHRTLMASGDGSVAICEECVSSFGAFFERRSSGA